MLPLDSVLGVHNLTLCYRDTTLLNAVSLTIKSGTITTLLGPSGSGKTLLGLSLQGLVPPNITKRSGDVFLNETLINPELYRGKVFANIMQNPRTCFNPLHTIQSHVKETLYTYKKPYDRTKIESTFNQVGLEANVLQLYSFEMSGGMLQRVMIALALLLETPFLIADEPSSDLDSLVWYKIVKLLIALCKEQNLGILLITHDLALALKISDSCILLHQGKIIKHYQSNACSLSFLESQMKAMYIKQEESMQSNHNQTTQTQQNLNHNARIKHNQIPLLCLENVSRHYFHYKIFHKIKKQILSNISLNIYPNQAIGLIGLSGSGKSTLARIMCVLEKPDSGKVWFMEKQALPKSLHERKVFYKQVQILFQDSLSSLNPRYNVYENLSEVLTFLLGVKDKNAQLERIIPILKQLRLDEKILYSYPAMLSGGQAQRVCIARVLLIQPKLIILDEITSNLDCILQHEVLEIFASLQSKSACSFVFITHDLSLARKFCQKLLLLDKGTILEEIANKERFQSVLGKELDSIHLSTLG